MYAGSTVRGRSCRPASKASAGRRRRPARGRAALLRGGLYGHRHQVEAKGGDRNGQPRTRGADRVDRDSMVTSGVAKSPGREPSPTSPAEPQNAQASSHRRARSPPPKGGGASLPSGHLDRTSWGRLAKEGGGDDHGVDECRADQRRRTSSAQTETSTTNTLQGRGFRRPPPPGPSPRATPTSDGSSAGTRPQAKQADKASTVKIVVGVAATSTTSTTDVVVHSLTLAGRRRSAEPIA